MVRGGVWNVENILFNGWMERNGVNRLVQGMDMIVCDEWLEGMNGGLVFVQIE